MKMVASGIAIASSNSFGRCRGSDVVFRDCIHFLVEVPVEISLIRRVRKQRLIIQFVTG